MGGDFAPYEAKMRADGLGDAAVAAFKNSYEALCSGATGMIPEAELTPAASVPSLDAMADPGAVDPALLAKTVVLKLNGGLGTPMGLDHAKSLLLVKGKDTFLDLTAKQIMGMREKLKSQVKFVLMNSFATSEDTMNFFKAKYPALYADPNLEFVQNKVPKIARDTLAPALWPAKPSACAKLVVKGDGASSKNVFVGSVTVKNESGEPKTLPPGKYENTTVDLSAAPGLGPMAVTHLKTKPIAGQKPGTSGVRKKTAVFMEGLYLHNFVQATLDAVKACGSDLTSQTLLVGGDDGRYYNDVAIQTIVKIAVANGVKRVWVAKDGLASTPADFGIKYNCENGGPAPEKLTDLIYANTCAISTVKIAEGVPAIDVSKLGETVVEARDGSCRACVEVVDGVSAHLDLLKTIFDMGAIQNLLNRPDFSICFDAMHGVTGPYAKALFCDQLGVPASALINAVPKDDFGGHHADPNLTYAVDLTKKMGVDKTGAPVPGGDVPSFGAASDGDGDRNMILGARFFVTPSDSLAILAAHADVIPFVANQGGLKAVARSMPTSGAVDRVAEALNLALFETPTGWKFFGNLMDSKALFGGVDYTPFLCGEESFGTGTIVKKHWATYGRNYYCRYDYEGVDKAEATKMMAKMTADAAANTGKVCGAYTIATADVFAYEDPVDGSVSKNQGVRFLMADGSRASSSASRAPRAPARRDLAKFTGRESPTVIT
ncbi:phosphoglucomutase [Aureococcus anophagefferens]|nr:phosphoglucomutase [Aureococcus anophagefferens]